MSILVCLRDSIMTSAPLSDSTLLITQFGAVGDGATLNTRAIQTALDQVAAQRGGEVVIPPGRFLTGTITIRSNTTLTLMTGATLLGSPRLEDYPAAGVLVHEERRNRHFIRIEEATNVRIQGGGVIDGNGEVFHASLRGLSKVERKKRERPTPMLQVRDSRNLQLIDIRIQNSPGWTCHFENCDEVTVRGVSICNDYLGANTDGFDVTGCRDVIISDCRIDTGDDAICLKTLPDSRSCERVTVTNCIIRTNCVALKLGAKESFQDMRQVTFSNCIVYDSNRAVGLYSLRGATVENIVVSNISCVTSPDANPSMPIHLDARRLTAEEAGGTIRQVRIAGVQARTNGRILLTAEEGCTLEQISLESVSLRFERPCDPVRAHEKCRSDQFSNRSPNARAAHGALVASNVHQLTVRDLQIDWGENAANAAFAAIWGERLRQSFFDNPLAMASRVDVAKYRLTDSEVEQRS